VSRARNPAAGNAPIGNASLPPSRIRDDAVVSQVCRRASNSRLPLAKRVLRALGTRLDREGTARRGFASRIPTFLSNDQTHRHRQTELPIRHHHTVHLVDDEVNKQKAQQRLLRSEEIKVL
jgi:hypothetical protein